MFRHIPLVLSRDLPARVCDPQAMGARANSSNGEEDGEKKRKKKKKRGGGLLIRVVVSNTRTHVEKMSADMLYMGSCEDE